MDKLPFIEASATAFAVVVSAATDHSRIVDNLAVGIAVTQQGIILVLAEPLGMGSEGTVAATTAASEAWVLIFDKVSDSDCLPLSQCLMAETQRFLHQLSLRTES